MLTIFRKLNDFVVVVVLQIDHFGSRLPRDFAVVVFVPAMHAVCA